MMPTDPVSPPAATQVERRSRWANPLLSLFAAATAGAALTLLGLWMYRASSGWISPADLLSVLAGEWFTQGAWTGRSINFNQGGTAKSGLQPVVITALWLALSSTILLFIQRPWSGRPIALMPYAVLALLGWLILDLRWQLDLIERAQRTFSIYAGLSESERQAAGPDRTLYPFMREIHAHLPDRPARIFLLTERPETSTAGRVRYHLLPHNASMGLSRLPAFDQTRPGDYVLIIAPMHQARYDRTRRTLSDGRTEWPVDPVFTESRAGALFRVRSESS